MRKWNTIMKKMAVLLLSAVLISAMMPVQLRAQEQSVQDETEIGAQSRVGAGTGVQSRDGAGSGAQSGADAGSSCGAGVTQRRIPLWMMI